jgi:ferredoxin-NADP reductase
VIFRRELLVEAQAQRGLRVAFALTRDASPMGEGDPGSRHRDADYDRRIDANIIAAELAQFTRPPMATFICGSNRFVSHVAELLVDMGVAPLSIRTERYGGEA